MFISYELVSHNKPFFRFSYKSFIFTKYAYKLTPSFNVNRIFLLPIIIFVTAQIVVHLVML